MSGELSRVAMEQIIEIAIKLLCYETSLKNTLSIKYSVTSKDDSSDGRAVGYKLRGPELKSLLWIQ